MPLPSYTSRTIVFVSIALFCFFPITTPAQERMEPRLALALRRLSEVPGDIQSQNHRGALRKLQDAIPLLEGRQGEDPRFKVYLENAYFLEAIVHTALQDWNNAVSSFERFVNTFPQSARATTARVLCGESMYQLDRWADIVTMVTPALRDARLDIDLKALGAQLVAIAHQELEQWDPAIAPLKWLISNSKDPEIRADSIANLCLCLVRLARYTDLYKFIPMAHASSAKYDIDLSLALLEEGDNRINERKLPEAILLYRLVVPYSTLSDYVGSAIAETQDQIAQMKRVRSGMTQQGRRIRALERRLASLEEKREDLLTYDDYDEELGIRLGNVYHDVSRFEEAIQLFLAVQAGKPTHELAQQAHYSAYMTAFSMGEIDRALELGGQHLALYPGGDFWDDLTMHMASVESQRENWTNTIGYVNKALEVSPDHVAKDTMYYLKGFSQFMLSDLEGAKKTFATIVSLQSNSAYVPSARYWHALAELFLQNYTEARDEFTEFTRLYSAGGLREDAKYEIGVAEYGRGDFPASKAAHEAFLEEYPRSMLASKAHAMIGDIQAADGLLDEAIETYKTAITTAVNMVQANYAVFQIARVYELESKWQEIIDTFNTYRERYGDEANYTESTYWMGNAYKQLGDPDTAHNLFYDTIISHGDDVEAYGVDFILRDLTAELLPLLSAKMDFSRTNGAVQLKTRLRDELTAAREQGKQTLTLRLLGLNYETTTNATIRATLARNLMDTNNIPLAAPVTLVTMGQIATEAKDDEFALQVYEHFFQRHETSDLLMEALRFLAEDRIRKEEYEAALEYLQLLTERFASMEEAASAFIRIGDVLRLLDRTEEAVETYSIVLSVKEWRGELWPQALVSIGDAYFENGQFKEAFGFYQRVYVMYVGYAEWAARAYVQSAKCLRKLGRGGEVRATLEEMLEIEELRTEPIAKEAKTMLLTAPES